MKKAQYSPPATLRVAMRAGNTPPLHHSSSPITIVSGGQTGADRAALDWALTHGVECGGWCPKGRKAEDGPIDLKYPLKEAPSESYIQRTEWNVRDSDATILFSIEPTLTGGSKKTVEFARQHKKPWLHLCVREEAGTEKLRAFVQEHSVKVLNVAGPRASTEPGVGEFVMRILEKAFSVRLR
jgi:Circularly permutated YpsA SLOG family